jgi:hypothetical protein
MQFVRGRVGSSLSSIDVIEMWYHVVGDWWEFLWRTWEMAPKFSGGDRNKNSSGFVLFICVGTHLVLVEVFL